MTNLVHRPRRLRRREGVRALVREARLAREDLILPLFACPGEGVRREVPSMPGVFNLSVDEIAREAAAAFDVGVPAVILFGLPESKDETASGAYAARGPFRAAADSAPAFGDRRAYQMDAANAGEAMREAELDVMEGADFLMVKPAVAYLDIVKMVRERFDLPLAAYHVSGEYAMIKAAAERGWIDEKRVMMETLTSIRRAGADVILTYYAVEAARELR